VKCKSFLLLFFYWQEKIYINKQNHIIKEKKHFVKSINLTRIALSKRVSIIRSFNLSEVDAMLSRIVFLKTIGSLG